MEPQEGKANPGITDWTPCTPGAYRRHLPTDTLSLTQALYSGDTLPNINVSLACLFLLSHIQYCTYGRSLSPFSYTSIYSFEKHSKHVFTSHCYKCQKHCTSSQRLVSSPTFTNRDMQSLSPLGKTNGSHSPFKLKVNRRTVFNWKGNWISVQNLPLTSCVTLGMSPFFSGLIYPFHKMRILVKDGWS